MRIERDGAARLIWIETSGVKQADERFQLTPCAVLRVQSSRR
jgi:hypothetical protein